MTTSTLLLTRADVRTLLSLDDCVEAVGRAFARQAAREDPPAALLSVHVLDNLEQSATIGELHHALERELATRESVHAELGELIAGTKAGRTPGDEITIFDSTGTAVQDVATAAVVYARSRMRGEVPRLDLAS